jgi:hypothetical protein
MAEYPEAVFADRAAKHVALLQYISDQLRCYSDELSAKDGVLPAFADMLDELAGELSSPQHNEAAQPAAEIVVQ